jgi:hypothetical protein
MAKSMKIPTGRMTRESKTRVSAKVESTSVSEWAYDSDTESLTVTYKGGRKYVYKAVPMSVVWNLASTESVGREVNKEVKGKYEYEEVK